ncbi:MAG: IS3 family transposase [Bacilli bacterium]
MNRFKFITCYHSSKYSISSLCKLLNVSRAGYYEFQTRRKSKTQIKREYIESQVIRVYKEHKGRYGSPRIANQLYEEGIETNKRVVAELMAKNSLVAITHKRKKNNNSNKFEEAVRENSLNRIFNQKDINNVWCGDITYVRCSDGTLYVSTYVDLGSRMDVSYDVRSNMKKELVLKSLEETFAGKRFPKMIHTDGGSQYRSYKFKELMEKYGISHSMSAPGTPIDNAVIESFFNTLKKELIYPNKGKTMAQMRILIKGYMEEYYPKKRHHTTIGMTPEKYEKMNYNVS